MAKSRHPALRVLMYNTWNTIEDFYQTSEFFLLYVCLYVTRMLIRF